MSGSVRKSPRAGRYSSGVPVVRHLARDSVVVGHRSTVETGNRGAYVLNVEIRPAERDLEEKEISHSAGFAICSTRGMGDLRTIYGAPRASWHLSAANVALMAHLSITHYVGSTKTRNEAKRV